MNRFITAGERAVTSILAVALASCAPAPAAPALAPADSASQPPSFVPAEVRVERDHEASVGVAAFRPDGGAVAFAAGAEVRVWPVAGAAPLLAARAPADVRALAWAGADRIVAITHAGATAWEIAGGAARQLATGGSEKNALDLVLRADGTRLARVADAGAGVVEIVDPGSGAVLRVLRTGEPKAALLGFFDEGRVLALRGERALSVWDVEAGTLRARCAACIGEGTTLSPDGRTAAIERSGETRKERTPYWIEVRDVATGRERARIAAWGAQEDPLQPVLPVRMGFTWSPNGRRAVVFTELHIGHSPANINSARLYDTTTWRAIANLGGFGGPCGMPEPTYAFSAGGAVLRYHNPCSDHPAVSLLDGLTGAPRGMLPWPSFTLWWSADGKRVAESWGTSLRVRDVATRATLLHVDGPQERTHYDNRDAAFRPDGGALAVAPDLAVWDFGRGPMIGRGAGVVTGPLSWSPGARVLFLGAGNDRTIGVYDGATGEPLRSPFGEGETGAVSADGRWFTIVRSCRRWSGDSCLAVAVADPTGARRLVAEVAWDRVETALSPDGVLFAIGGDREERRSADGSKVERPGEHEVRIFRRDTGAEVGRIPDQHEVGRLAFSPDGQRLLIAQSSSASVWSVSTSAAPARLLDLRTGVEPAVAWSRDGRVIIVGHGDRPPAVRLLDLDGKPIAELTMGKDVVNRRALVERDLAAAVTAEIAAQPARLQRALDLGELVALSPDLSLVARGAHDVDLVRVGDGRALRLMSFRAGGGVQVVIDDAGRFDGDAASIARVRLRSAETGGEWVSAGPVFEAHRKPGLLKAFIGGDEAVHRR